MTNPSRVWLNGREAFSGESLKFVESARSVQKPAKVRGTMLASAPATMTTSACPVRMAPMAWPMAWALDEQAVEIVKFGPFAPHMIARTPEAELSVTMGMKLGVTRFGLRF
jgi:hypothetical protein